jgi:hypothetical protein
MILWLHPPSSVLRQWPSLEEFFLHITPSVDNFHCRNALLAQDQITKIFKFLALQRLRKKITNHHVGGTVANLNLPLLHLICNREIPNVDCSSSFTGGSFSVGFQQDCTLVILMYDVERNPVSLFIQEQSRPKYQI